MTKISDRISIIFLNKPPKLMDSDVKDINNFMNAFEAFIHPKNLFFIIPTGIFAYWAMTTYVPSFFKKVQLFLKYIFVF